MKKLLKAFIPLMVIAILVISGYFYWQHQKFFPTTDDAYIQAHVIDIAPRISGQVVNLYVQNHQHVKAGQRLFAIDPLPFQIALTKAQATLETTIQQYKADDLAIKTAESKVTQAHAELIDTKAETQRMLVLVKQKYASQSQGDLAVKNLRVAYASLKAAASQLAQTVQQRGQLGPNNSQIRAAKAAVAQATLNVRYTDVTAPASGYIANLELRDGDVVTAYQKLFAIIEDQSWWAEANYKETQLARIQPGQTATIKIDMYPNQTFSGKVVSLSSGSGSSFSLLPPENASGNWVKVTQRFPVKVLITEQKPKYPLRLGASATVVINTKHHE